MKLTLKCIRQHLDRTLEFPDTGIIKISGKSGIGKTTVLDAFRHLLLGDVDGMVNWDQSNGSITAEWMGYEIKRTMRPNTLTFTDPQGNVSKDETAQGEIFKMLGMNSEEVLASSLIEQGMPSSLLSLKPAEQLRFIQRLAFGDSDPETTKKRIAALVSDRKTRLSISESAEIAANKKRDDAHARIESLEASHPPMIAKCRSPEEVADMEAKLTQGNNLLKTLNRDLREARVGLDNPVFIEMAGLEARKKQNAEEVASLNQQIATAHNDLAKLPPQETAEVRTARQESMAAIKSGLQYLKILDEAKAASAEIKVQFKLGAGSPSEGLKIMLQALMQENSAITMDQSEAVNELNRLRETPEAQSCPHCQGNLMIDDGRIIAHSHDRDGLAERIVALEVKIENFSLDRRKNQRARDAVTAAASRLELLRGKLLAHKVPSFTTAEEAEAELGQLDDATKSANFHENARSTLVSKIDTLGKMLENSVTKHQLYVSSLNERHSKAQPIEVLKQKIAKLEKDQSSTMDATEALSSALAAERENARIMTEYRLHQQRVEAAGDALATAIEQAKDAEVEAAEARTRMAAALRLKELSDKAVMEAVDSIVAGINVNARHYVDSMFPDDGTVVQLTNKKVLSDGDERAKMGMKVSHKGSNPSGIGEFSGGEKMRLALAFQLGMADMYKSPFLMIDEALAWLDLEAKERCLETLRPLALTRLILVVEHGLPDHCVDHIISL